MNKSILRLHWYYVTTSPTTLFLDRAVKYESAFSMKEKLIEVAEITADIYKEGFSEIVRQTKELSPFVKDDTDTPLCIARSCVVSKTGHNISFAFVLIAAYCLSYVLTQPYEKEILVTNEAENIEIEFLSSKSLIATGTALFSTCAAGITLFCTKKSAPAEQQISRKSQEFKKQ